MKNIKFFRYLGLAISAGLLLGFSSCSDDDDYAPGNPAPDNCMGVYFDAGNAAEFILTPDQETVDVKVCRKVAAEAASVPVKVEYTDSGACYGGVCPGREGGYADHFCKGLDT